MRRRDWNLPEARVTPEGADRELPTRRRFLARTLVGSLALPACAIVDRVLPPKPADPGQDPSFALYPAERSERFTVDRPMTDEEMVLRFNNYFEFGGDKQIWRNAQKLAVRPWTVVIDGLVEKPTTLAIDELFKKMTLEERVYRHRCVEAWSMVVPWSGFPLRDLVALARPLGSAKYLRMETFLDRAVAVRQLQAWMPWPYVEALTIAEATHELAFLATGLYGKPLAKQNGAPLRLVVPWKYGFKSVKAIVRFTFTEERPATFWNRMEPEEYGFWANVNPHVPHPRWSQETETMLGTGVDHPTVLFNGYGEWVAGLYRGLEDEPLYF